MFNGTYYFALTNDIVRKMADAYSQPSKKNGKPLHEAYALNLEKDFIEAAVTDKVSWKQGYHANGKLNEEYHEEDLDRIWNAANDLKQAAGGIGIAGLNEGTIWAIWQIKEF